MRLVVVQSMPYQGATKAPLCGVCGWSSEPYLRMTNELEDYICWFAICGALTHLQEVVHVLGA